MFTVQLATLCTVPRMHAAVFDMPASVTKYYIVAVYMKNVVILRLKLLHKMHIIYFLYLTWAELHFITVDMVRSCKLTSFIGARLRDLEWVLQ